MCHVQVVDHPRCGREHEGIVDCIGGGSTEGKWKGGTSWRKGRKNRKKKDQSGVVDGVN